MREEIVDKVVHLLRQLKESLDNRDATIEALKAELAKYQGKPEGQAQSGEFILSLSSDTES